MERLFVHGGDFLKYALHGCFSVRDMSQIVSMGVIKSPKKKDPSGGNVTKSDLMPSKSAP
ncbi:hypothetical protein IFM89_007576, partial [Coptis chinensis]